MEMHRKQKHRGLGSATNTTRKPRRVKVVLDPTISPMSHMGFQGARHMHPERLPTKQQEKATAIRLFDLRQETIENVRKIAENIKRLMVNNLKLKSVPENLLDTLLNLEKLDLGHNCIQDGGLPEAIKKLENLVELNLTDNKLTKIPSCVRRLKSLCRLDLSHNAIESLKGIEKNRRVQILVVDHNRLSSIFTDISPLRRLEILRCSHNNLRDIGPEIRNLKALTDLDISNNKIVVLPTDVFQLPKLEALNATRNEISKVPSFNIRVHNKHWVSEIDLSENAITQFPGHLLHMAIKIDLSCNKLKVLDMNAMKQLEKYPDHDLVVDENPLTFPPPEISGINSILHYLHEARLNATVYRGLKVLVLGAHKSGKTSLVQSLVDEQARLTSDNGEISSGIEAYDMRIDYQSDDVEHGKYLQLSIWDFCGHPFYMYPHYVFFEQPSVTILTFNMKEYTPEKFDELIGSWFDWMIAKANKLVVLIVGTHADLVPKQTVKQVTADVKTKMDNFKSYHQKIIKDRIAKIDAIPEIKPTHSDQLISLNKLLACMETLTIQTDVLITSASSYSGFDHLRDALNTLANNKNLFPKVLTEVPTFWVDVQNYVEEKGNAMVVPVMRWNDFFDEMTEKFGMKRTMKEVTLYLHETGKVIWAKKDPTLSKYVFLRPSWLFEILRHVYCHDQETCINYEAEDSFKQLGFSLNKFERYKKQLLNEGVMESDFLKGVLGQLLPLDDNGPFEEVERLLVEAFEAGYPVSRKSKDGQYKLDIELEPETKITKVLMPWLRKVDESEQYVEMVSKLRKKRKLVAILSFPKYMPPGLFEIICVRCQKHKDNKKNENDQKESKPSLKFLSHWGGGFLAEHTDKPVLVKIHYKRGSAGNMADIIYEIRDNTSEDAYEETPPCDMWTVLLPLLMIFEELLKEYQGVLVERKMQCPLCEKASFLGEWLTPKDTQGMDDKQCEACGGLADTAYLVQPRDEKRMALRRNFLDEMRSSST